MYNPFIFDLEGKVTGQTTKPKRRAHDSRREELRDSGCGGCDSPRHRPLLFQALEHAELDV